MNRFFVAIVVVQVLIFIVANAVRPQAYSDIIDYRRKRESGKKEAGPCLEGNLCQKGYSCEEGSCFATSGDGASQNGDEAADE
ncbi:hypothetical protein Ddc_00082 [Ditylenchus destructor]|nr:hypothetical protein Ddc_00082 [Ditylenchus destructor]